jgi:hypothetical protein
MTWNKFSDYTDAQWTLKLQSHKLASDNTLMMSSEPYDKVEMSNNWDRIKYMTDALAKSPVNWVEQKMVTEVKDQGTCGAGYAFAVVGALESMQAINRGNRANLSPQQIIDCETGGYNKGCGGGAMTYALEYAVRQGLMYDAYYPF